MDVIILHVFNTQAIFFFFEQYKEWALSQMNLNASWKTGNHISEKLNKSTG